MVVIEIQILQVFLWNMVVYIGAGLPIGWIYNLGLVSFLKYTYYQSLTRQGFTIPNSSPSSFKLMLVPHSIVFESDGS